MNELFFKLFKKTVKYMNFEDMQFAVKNPDTFMIINTLPVYEQGCLIRTTILCDKEENLVNELLTKGGAQKIVVYGQNDVDETVDKKYQQLRGLGLTDIHIYRGGLFEWLLLQDIYGTTEFPTTSKILDLLKFRPRRTYDNKYIM
jgi:hypothetical protein